MGVTASVEEVVDRAAKLSTIRHQYDSALADYRVDGLLLCTLETEELLNLIGAEAVDRDAFAEAVEEFKDGCGSGFDQPCTCALKKQFDPNPKKAKDCVLCSLFEEIEEEIAHSAETPHEHQYHMDQFKAGIDIVKHKLKRSHEQ